jgi:hypothetical protein
LALSVASWPLPGLHLASTLLLVALACWAAAAESVEAGEFRRDIVVCSYAAPDEIDYRSRCCTLS